MATFAPTQEAIGDWRDISVHAWGSDIVEAGLFGGGELRYRLAGESAEEFIELPFRGDKDNVGICVIGDILHVVWSRYGYVMYARWNLRTRVVDKQPAEIFLGGYPSVSCFDSVKLIIGYVAPDTTHVTRNSLDSGDNWSAPTVRDSDPLVERTSISVSPLDDAQFSWAETKQPPDEFVVPDSQFTEQFVADDVDWDANPAITAPTSYWTFDTVDITDPGFGNATAHDVVGSNDATIVYNIVGPNRYLYIQQFSGSQVGEMLNFVPSGSAPIDPGDHVTLGTGVLDFTGSFSVHAWFRSHDNEDFHRIIQNRGTGSFGTQDGWFIRIGGSAAGDAQIQFALESGGFTLTGDAPPVLGNFNFWNHLICTFNSATGEKRVYLNGGLVYSETNANLIGADFTSGREGTIGCSLIGTETRERYEKFMAEVAMWNGTVLSPTEVALIYDEGVAGNRFV